MKRQHSEVGRDSESGFSLLEILVAFSILAITLGVLLEIFSKGIHSASASEKYTRALLLAESTLDTVGQTQEIEIGENSGVVDDIYEWSIDIQPYEDEDSDPEFGNPQFSLYRVRVSVHWEKHRVVLTTLRFGPPV